MFVIVLHGDAARFLDSLDITTKERIKKKLGLLEADPHPTGCIKLRGTHNTFRIRIGDYRALYYVDY